MYILKERAEVSRYAGNTDFDAEVTIQDDDNKTVYIHVHYGYDCTQFSAGYVSLFDLPEDSDEPVEFMEEYEEFEDTETSKYAKYFAIAERMIDDLADSYK